MDSTNSLRDELQKARHQTDLLFRFVSPDSLYRRPVSERHRLIFYLGHLDAFDWNLLGRRLSGESNLHPTFDSLFERGIDPEPGQAPADKPADWPSAAEVNAYNLRARDWVDGHVDELHPFAVQMVIEHRYMHAETLAYLMHKLPYEAKQPGPAADAGDSESAVNEMVAVPAGVATLGSDMSAFGWDNEHLAHAVPVPAFRISRFKISNGEYLKYVEEAAGSPSNFWLRDSGRWMYRGMFGVVPLPLSHPAWISWQQASAYAAWRGLKLPTEAQFHRAAALSKPDAKRDNFNFEHFDPIPVDAGANGLKVPHQMIGNGWEWTRDVFAPFEGFSPSPLYAGYSADFFDGNHYVMKGASPRTAALLTRPSFRNWFRPEYPHMYAGFRLVAEE